MNTSLEFKILGAGVWARGLHSFTALASADGVPGVATGDAAFNAVWEPPAPAAIPPKERRRAGTFINLAVEVAHQACDAAGVDKSGIPSVFASSMGDSQITDYMCRKLVGAEKLLSPTQFHNSVHNAASGYWSISAVNRAPSTFVGGFDRSFGAGLFEAVVQAESFGAAVVLVCYDIGTTAPLRDIQRIDEVVGVALVLAPRHYSSSKPPLAHGTLAYRSGAGVPLPAATRIPPTLMQGSAQPDGLNMLDTLASLVQGETTSSRLSIPMPRTGHLAVTLQCVGC